MTPSATPPPVLEVKDISIAFGGLKAVEDFSLSLPAGALYGLIGPNGAGKTTVFNLLTGVYRPQAGAIRIDGHRLDGRKPHLIVHAGLVRTFQNIRLFGALSVLDNVKLGCQMRRPHGLWATVLRTGGSAESERVIGERCRELLELFGLSSRIHQQAGNLSYGDQRRLEIARALGTEPKVLLLDEPAAGMNPKEKLELMELIHFIRDRFKLTVLLIEHDMKLVMTISQQITVLDHGQTIAVGTPQEIQQNPKVIEAYLGEPVQAMLLTVRNLEVRYGAIGALGGVSLEIDRAEIVALIGANGAGKTTLLRTISGLLRPRAGSVTWQREGSAAVELQSLRPDEIVRCGISHVPEGRQIFANLTVLENLLLGGYQQPAAAAQGDLGRIYELFPVLAERQRQRAGTLSGGEQQQLAIGRALMAKPTLLLLDEPSLGLAPLIVRRIFQIIRQINATGTTVFLIEQNAHMALGVAHRGYVLQSGQVILADTAQKLLENPDVQRAYLGG